ncbi:MAG TPA: 3-keto-5-aminohexanoate cleavage protein [Ktedonobacterales bacterium]|jgi:3-keto-5-aminohexanoate cleavage enzyme
MDKLVITVAPTGAETTRADNPALPLQPGEIAEAVAACREAGAAVAHLHARDAEGHATQAMETYAAILAAVRRRCPDIITMCSTGGAAWMTLEERSGPLETPDPPEMASLTCGTCNFGDEVFSNPLAFIRQLARRMAERGISPEVEVFEPGMIATALLLQKEGVLQDPIRFNFVLGVPGAFPASPKNLLFLAESIPAGMPWTVTAIGRQQLPMAALAIVLGGHVRVGFEDNVWYSKGRLAASNAELVARVVRIAEELGREVATPAEARRLLGLAMASK